jgi:hypothetical protein
MAVLQAGVPASAFNMQKGLRRWLWNYCFCSRHDYLLKKVSVLFSRLVFIPGQRPHRPHPPHVLAFGCPHSRPDLFFPFDACRPTLKPR